MAHKTVVLALLLCMLVASINGKAKLHGSDHKYKVENQYVAVIKTKNIAPSFDWDNFKELVKNKYGILIKNVIEYGQFRAVFIHTNHSINDLLEEHDIDFIETNQKFSLDTYSSLSQKFEVSDIKPDLVNVNNSFCLKQNSDWEIWGLGRMNQRDQLKRFGHPSYSWSNEDTGSGVCAYVMDTGINIEHTDFEGRAVHGFISSSIAESEDSKDYKGHGTHVAGKIAGSVFGVAKEANLIAVKVLDRNGAGTTIDLIEGLQYVYNDIKEKQKNGPVRAVINLSLGAYGSAPTLERAVRACLDYGLHIVVAAGNDYDDACLYTPGRVSEVITVGSSTKKDQLSYFSNYGPCVDIVAPGSDITSTWIDSTTSVSTISGTSMACPHVAGAVARYLSRPWADDVLPSPDQVKKYILDLATKNELDLDIGNNGPSVAQSTPNSLLYMPCSTESVAFSQANFMKWSSSIFALLVLVHSF